MATRKTIQAKAGAAELTSAIETPQTPAAEIVNRKIPDTVPEKFRAKVGDEEREIKATKLKYFRSGTVGIYKFLRIIPLNEFISYESGVFDPEKSADQLLFEFLVAVFDDEEFVKRNYDEFNADDIEKFVKAFGELNHLDEKEEAAKAKNSAAQVNN